MSGISNIYNTAELQVCPINHNPKNMNKAIRKAVRKAELKQRKLARPANVFISKTILRKRGQ